MLERHWARGCGTSRGQVQGRAKAGEVGAMRVSPRKLRESWVWAQYLSSDRR